MNVAFVCVNYNNWLLSRNYVLSCLEIHNNETLNIIIVDNNSHDSDLINLRSFINQLNDVRVTLLESDTNVGYFAGLNIGLNYLKINQYDYVLVGNNDLTFDNNFLKILENKKIESDIFVICPNIIRPDGTFQNPHFINKFSFLQNIYRKIYFSNYYISILCQYIYNSLRILFKSNKVIESTIEQKIFMGYGACYILTKNFFKYFLKLDDPVFLMGEEGVITNQVLSGNGSILYAPNLIVQHLDHSSIGKISSKKLYNHSRNSYKVYSTRLKHIHNLYK
jgi:GT2 family glycosyltransferase